jgi:hypothetical protein
VLRLIRRLLRWWNRPPTEDDLTGRTLRDAKAGEPARGYSPPPPPTDYFGP